MPSISSNPRRATLFLFAFLILILCAPPATAQEARWRELTAQVEQLYKQGKYSDAIPVAQEALRVAESTFGPEDPNVATSLNNLADIYRKQGRYADAEPLVKRALTIREKVLGPDHPDVAESLSNLADLYYYLGRYAEAESLDKRALAIYEKTLGPEHPYVTGALNDLALLNGKQGRYAEAESLYKRALGIREKVLGPENADVAESLDDLAMLYDKQGRYAEAEPLDKRALAIREKILGPESPYVATSLNNLALLYDEQGRYAEAEPLDKRALAIYEKALGPEHPYVAASLNDLALLYHRLGRYAEAEPLYKRALTINEKVLGPDRAEVAQSLNNLAALNLNQGRYAEAEPLDKRALAIYEKTLGPEHPYVAISLDSLAELYFIQGRYAEAELLDRRALAIREKVLEPGHPYVATSLNNLALLYEEQGRYAEAEPLDKRALAIYEKTLGPEHPYVAISLHNLARLYYAEKSPRQAASYFDRSLAVLSRQFDYYFSYMSEKDRLAFLRTVSNRFPLYFNFCLNYREQLPALSGKMDDVVLWEKGFIAQSVAAVRAQIEASGDKDALNLLDQLAAKKTQLARLLQAQPKDREQWRKQVDQLEQEANDLEKELVKRSASLAEQKKLAHVSWRDVQKSLKLGEAAVEFIRFPCYDSKKLTDSSCYVALVVTPESSQPSLIVLVDAKDPNPLEKGALRNYRQNAGLQRVSTNEVNATFYDVFWKPLQPALAGAKRIYLSPDGALNQISFAAVPDSDGKLLIERYDLRIVNSTKDLLREKRAASTNSAVLIGNPVFDLAPSKQREAELALQKNTPTTATAGASATATPSDPSASTSATASASASTPASANALAPLIGVRGGLSRDFRGGALEALPATQIELQSIDSLLEKQNWRVQLFTEQNALKDSVKRVQRPRVLHIATHGFFEPDQDVNLSDRAGSNSTPAGLEDPMLRSGLFFAGANRTLAGEPTPPGLDDGILTAYEATGLNLQGTELVVLSACETGLGEVSAGEGVFGLRRALQVAGADSVLLSMWSVPDKETQELMTLFYSNWLSGKDKPTALRDAQLELRKTVTARYGKDSPFYWGAFVLVGR
jgi:CHAT domain-containing protein/Flp pilus assembly protein TadD